MAKHLLSQTALDTDKDAKQWRTVAALLAPSSDITFDVAFTTYIKK